MKAAEEAQEVYLQEEEAGGVRQSRWIIPLVERAESCEVSMKEGRSGGFMKHRIHSDVRQFAGQVELRQPSF